MNHIDEARLNDYADRLLPPDDAAAVEDHLRSCDRCAARVRSIRRLSADLASLPRSIQPERDLRPAPPRPASPGRVARPRGPVRPWLRAAAVAGLLAAAGATWMLAGGPGREEAVDTADGADVTPIAPYDEATRALVAALDRRRPEVGAAVMGLVDRNLAVVDEAIRELERARARHPDDAELARLLADRYATRLALLRDALTMLTEA